MEERTSRRAHPGFTLIELVVVIAIAGVLAAVALPGFLAMLPDLRLKGAARDLYSNMQKARMGAVKDNQRWAIKFDSGAKSYTLCSSWVSSSDYFVEETIRLDDYASDINYQAAGITYTSNTAVFNPKGTGKAGTILLKNNRNTEFQIRSQTSGVITLKRKVDGVWK